MYTTNRINTQKIKTKHIIIKLLKTKDKEEKVAKAKQHITYRGNIKLIIAGFSSEALRVKREWTNLPGAQKTCQSRILCPTEFFFKYEGEIKSLFCKQKGAYYMIPCVCVCIYI